MKQDTSDKTPHERFTELGTRLMRVPRAKVTALEKKWQAKRAKRRKK